MFNSTARSLLLVALLAACATAINPIPSLVDPAFTDIADPCTLEHEGRLYVYPTASQTDFSVYYADLPNDDDDDFDPSTLAFVKSDEPVLSANTTGSCPLTSLIPALGVGTLTWAPHVHFDSASEKFYMYYSVCLSLYVATADSPLGPFEGPKLLKHLAIDPMAFEDDDGKLYLLYSDISLLRIWIGEESIYVQPLSDPTTFDEDAGGATQLIKPDQHPWEFFRSSLVAPRGINEGPWMIKKNDTYYLMYSGAGADTYHYNIGYATASSPLGPFTKFAQNPISVPQLPESVGVFGPGHHAVWTDERTGRSWVFYHQKQTQENGWDRNICVDELLIDGETGALSIEVSRGVSSVV